MTTIEKEPTPSASSDASLPVDGNAVFTRRGIALDLTLTGERVAWLVLAAAAILTRFWELGARVMSHDESLHVYYSWFLAKGSGYAHNPMMHGPWLFESTALINSLFGASDFTSRLVPALLGIGIVIAIPLLLRPWVGRWGAFALSVLFLVSPYVLYYSRYNRHDIQVIAWALLALFATLAYLRRREEKFLLLLAGALGLMLSTMEIAFFYLAIFAGFLVLRILALYRLRWGAIRGSAEWDLLVTIGTLGAFFSSTVALLVLNPLWTSLNGAPFVDLTVLSSYGIEWSQGEYGPRIWGLMAAFWLGATAIGMLWNWRLWPKLAAIFLSITVILFTTFLTNPAGIGTGFIGSLGYWLSQHEVQRGGQPWYFYFIVFPLYEYLPLLAGLAAMVAFPFLARLQSAATRAYVVLAGLWAIGILAGLSIAGEKMPWLSTHITVPFILLAGWLAGQVIERLAASLGYPTEPLEPDAAAGGVHLVEVDENEQYIRHVTPYERPAAARRVAWGAAAGAAALAVLLLMTLRTSYLVNYVNYDYTTEFVGYAHGAPGVKWAMDNVEIIAERTGLGKGMTVAYDSNVSWPMTWYLRDYPGFFGDQPNRGALANAPVVIVSSSNWQKTEAYLGSDYSRYEVIRMWWPMEDYKGLSWERISDALTDPAMRAALWDIFWSKDYRAYAALTGQMESLNPPLRWPLEDRMRVYIRKDLAEQGVTAELKASQLEDVAFIEVDAYVGKELNAQPSALLAPGLTAPRNLAFAPDGTLYVADSGGSRILHMGRDGSLLGEWGRRTPDGQNPPDPGTFNEPWGLAIDADGNVYVADTWNHRIQKFDAAGNFLTQWGVGGLSSEGPDRFWGPRGVAIGADGRVYVTDTGNRRVAAFTADGQHLFDFDTRGEGMLDEPVGIAVGPNGRLYVADTWNRRVAVFNPEGQFERSWAVHGWVSTSVENKPYIAIDAGGRVYVTDPEGYRVIAFDNQGEALGVFGQFGEEDNSFGMPNGIAAGPEGDVWIADAGNNRISAYPGVQP